MYKRILNYEELTNHGNLEGRRIAAEIMEAGLSATDPYNNTTKLVTLKDGILTFEGKIFEPQNDPHSGPAVFDLNTIDRVFVFGLGKGIQRITKALEDILGDYLTGGHVLGKHGDEVIMEKVGVTLGGHPTPDIYCVEGCRRIVEVIENAHFTKNDLVITAIGNGIGSLCTYPVEQVPIDDVTEMVRLMQIEYGMPTSLICHLRNNVDRLKGGRISRMIHPAKMVHLLGVSASSTDDPNRAGYYTLLETNVWLHTLADNTSAQQALEIIETWDVKHKTPQSVLDYLRNFDSANETVRLPEYESFDARIFGVMPPELAAVPSAMERAKELGYTPYILAKRLSCEASQAGLFIGHVARTVDDGVSVFKPPCALFSSGEVLVTCGENPGVGGRNQELTLSGATVIRGNRRIVMSAVDTDGTDGPGGEFHPDATAKGITVLTGGIVDGYTTQEAVTREVDVPEALRTHSTSKALWELDSGIAAIQNISIGDLQCTIIMDHDGATE
ncbi:MAG: DUF4147 domain-containing protein [Oscillospiraceae bacterium]|nr:DUF4147 domain-containing protein [Oscillospiraceae bacterium]